MIIQRVKKVLYCRHIPVCWPYKVHNSRAVFLRLFFLFFLLSLQVPAWSKSLSADRKSWQQDFDQLQIFISEIYPNLEIALEFHRLDLPLIKRETQLQLAQATSKDQAIKIIQNFIGQFKDGHFKAQPLETQTKLTIDEPINKSTSGLEACRSFGVEPKNVHFAFFPNKEMGFGDVYLQGLAFPYTTLKVKNKKVGFIKIPSFTVQDYPEVCAESWEIYRKTLAGACDTDCKDKFMYEVAPNNLLEKLARAIETLKRENISSLVVDLANNGGGNDWVSAVTRMLTKKPILCGQFGFVRHPHWTKTFEQEIKEFKDKLEKTTDVLLKEKIQKELHRAEFELIESQKKCDRSRVWRDKKFRFSNCDQIVKRQAVACEPKDEFHYTSGIYDGPLYVIINSKTASAAEDIVGRLKESGAATLIGARTYGAGCGQTNGGIDLRLKNLNLKISMPDCARYLRTGLNEVAGIAPDVDIPILSIGTIRYSLFLKDYFEKNL